MVLHEEEGAWLVGVDMLGGGGGGGGERERENTNITRSTQIFTALDDLR